MLSTFTIDDVRTKVNPPTVERCVQVQELVLTATIHYYNAQLVLPATIHYYNGQFVLPSTIPTILCLRQSLL